jgi:DNA polymerase-3 subunit alpha
MKNSKFIRWHCHSVGSVRDGMITIKDMVTEAKNANELVSLTDHGSITMLIEYLNECKKQDWLPVCGIEAYLNNNKFRLKELSNLIANEKDGDVKKQLQEERDSKKTNAHLVIVAKNNHGLMNLIKLNNHGYVNGFYNRPLVTYDELFSLPKDANGDRGLIISSACMAGTIPHLFLLAAQTKNKKYLIEAEEFIKIMISEFGKDFYLEVQSNGIDEQKKINKLTLQIAKKLNVKVVIGMDSHYISQKAFDTHQDLLLIQDKKLRADVGKVDIKITWENNKGEKKSRKVDPENAFRKGYIAKDIKVGDTFGKGKAIETVISVEEIPRVWTFATDKVYFKSEVELRKEVKKIHKELVEDLDWIIECTTSISDKIEPVEFDNTIKLPTIQNAEKTLVDKVKKALKDKKLVSPEYVSRVKVELDRIKENGFCEYFLILADMLDYAKAQDIPLGVGRGSAGGSLVAFLLGIHRIDPLLPLWKGNMNFDRFLQDERNLAKVVVYDINNVKQEFVETDSIEVMRGKNKLNIQAIELQENDKILSFERKKH